MLSESLADAARDAVEAIAVDLRRGSAVSVERGTAAQNMRTDAFSALFHAYGDVAGVVGDGFSSCASIVDHWIDRFEGSRRPSLFGGWGGLGWIVTHLEAEDETIGQQLDRMLIEKVSTWPNSLGYDLISGLVGVGVYFVERAPREAAHTGLKLILDALQTSAMETSEGTTWFTESQLLPPWQRQHAPKGYYNLGTAHGVPGVCWLLASVCAIGIDVDRAESLLRTTLRWLRSKQKDPGLGELPSWIAVDVERRENRRIAWCYGPLGAGAVALKAAQQVGDAETVAWAHELTLACARVAPEEAGIQDAGLCHGAAGNAQIFHRLYGSTSEMRFADAAAAWIRATIGYRQRGVGVGGYRMWGDVGTDRADWLDDGSFLTGSAGVGLSLLAAITDIEPNWDRLLLLS